MRKRLLASALALLAVASRGGAQGTSPPEVPAQTAPSPALSVHTKSFGSPGTLAVAAERLFGWTRTSSSGDSATTFSFLGTGFEADFPYSSPRVAFDYFPVGGFSFGLGAGFAIIKLSSGTITTVTLSPRIGYAIRLSDGFSLWPRAGLTYVHADEKRQSDTGGTTFDSSEYLVATSLELQVVVTPVQHFGFMIGPTADLGIASTPSGFVNRNVTQLGAKAGLIGWF